MRSLKILFISDEPSSALWDHFDRSRLDGIDLIISCGDLPPQAVLFKMSLAAYPPPAPA